MTGDHCPLDGPRRLLPHLIDFHRRPDGLFRALATRHGEPFSVPSPFGGRMAVTGRPDLVAAIFRAGPDSFRLVDRRAGEVFSRRALSALDGEDYVEVRRRVMAAPVLRNPMLAAPAMRDAALRAFASRADGRVVRLGEAARDIALDASIGSIFGALDETERREFAQAVATLRRSIPMSAMLFQALRRDLGRYSPWGRFLRARERCFELIDRRMAAVRDGRADGNSVLAAWSTSTGPDGRPAMTDDEIRGNLLTLLFGGHDTTAAAIAWGAWRVHREPGVLAALRDELSDFTASLDVDLLRGLPWLTAVCREVLRIHAIAPGAIRRLDGPMTLGGATVGAGGLIMAATDLAMGDPTVFEEPHRFRPERFVGRSYRATEYFPFGGGERRCPGAAMAETMLATVLATLVARFDVALVDRGPARTVWYNGLRVPRGGVRAVLAERAPE